MGFLDNTGITDLVTYLRSKFAALVGGFVAVSQGGTGKGTHTTNAVLTGNGTSAVNNVSTASGALYATAANGAAQFGTLPVAQGGTNGTTEAEARENLEVPVNAAIATVEGTTATANHAVGDHFMLDDKLKTATAAIATGETINASNSADATVQGQIDTLRDSVNGSFTSQSVSLQSGFELRGGTYVKRHGVVSINLGITVKTTVEKNAQVNLGTITGGNIGPISSVEILLRPFGSGNDTVASITIGSDNSLVVRAIFADIPAGSFFWIRTSYFTSV